MTAAAFAAGVVLGASLAAVVAVRLHLRWAEEHHYREHAVSDERARALAAQADHDHRVAERATGDVDAVRAEARERIGDLLDYTAHLERMVDARDRMIARLRRPRHRVRPRPGRGAMPAYGRELVSA